MHDDHSDACAMMCDYLARLRAADVLDVQKEHINYDVIFNTANGGGNANPFNSTDNPFGGLSGINPFIR